jgi:hypothetical protein
VRVSSFTDRIVNDDLTHLSGVVTIYLTAVNMKNSSINLAVQFRPKLFIQLNCQQDARRDHYDGLGAVCLLKATQTVKDHRKGLAAACRAGDTTDSSSQQGIKDTLLVGA